MKGFLRYASSDAGSVQPAIDQIVLTPVFQNGVVKERMDRSTSIHLHLVLAEISLFFLAYLCETHLHLCHDSIIMTHSPNNE